MCVLIKYLVNARPKNMGDGPDTYTDYALQRRGKRHDYFTSCLPWPAKPADVSMFAATAQSPIVSDGTTFNWATTLDTTNRLVNVQIGGVALNTVHLGGASTGANASAIWGNDTG